MMEAAAMDGERLSPCLMTSWGVNQQVISAWPQIVHCNIHGHEGSLKDIDTVDLCRINNPNSYRDGLLIDCIEELFSPLRAQPLGIVKMGKEKLVREYGCCCHYRPGQRASSSLVYAGNLRITLFPGLFFKLFMSRVHGL